MSLITKVGESLFHSGLKLGPHFYAPLISGSHPLACSVIFGVLALQPLLLTTHEHSNRACSKARQIFCTDQAVQSGSISVTNKIRTHPTSTMLDTNQCSPPLTTSFRTRSVQTGSTWGQYEIASKHQLWPSNLLLCVLWFWLWCTGWYDST